MEQPSYLGLDLSLVDRKDTQSKIVKSCTKCWFLRNPAGLHNWGDCSGFVKAVQQDLGLQPFRGKANSIFKEVEERSDWLVIGDGPSALPAAGAAANTGSFTIGVWPNPNTAGHGHVVIITGYSAMLGTRAQHAMAAWGKLDGVGQIFGRISGSFTEDQQRATRYAKSIVAVL